VRTPTSPKSSEKPVEQLYRKPRADVFTVLLVIALLGIIVATYALWLVMQDYDYKIKGAPVVWNRPAASQLMALSNHQSQPGEQGCSDACSTTSVAI
jgi:hypothetical protein